MLKNDLLLQTLQGKKVKRPPVWMMRQAGRYLPQYMRIREKYDFFTRVQTPELACEITLQPIDVLQPDAAIIFSDILVVPQSMGIHVQLEENKGPILSNPISSKKDIESLEIIHASDRLNYVYEAIRLTKKKLNNRVPLIGFAGAPFTILCYMIEGKGSKNFEKAKSFCFTNPTLAHNLLQKITEVSILYLQKQVQAGADCIQIFDSWSGVLSPKDFNTFAIPYLNQIVNAIYTLCPIIVFPKGSWYALENLNQSNANAIGIDWTITPQFARTVAPQKILQGNFDPIKLLLPPSEIKKEVKKMITDFGTQNYIANLGHGILPYIPIDNARAFIDAVKEFEA